MCTCAHPLFIPHTLLFYSTNASATIEQIEWPILLKITDRILKEVPGVNRVCYDMSPKPSATIEWE